MWLLCRNDCLFPGRLEFYVEMEVGIGEVACLRRIFVCSKGCLARFHVSDDVGEGFEEFFKVFFIKENLVLLEEKSRGIFLLSVIEI